MAGSSGSQGAAAMSSSGSDAAAAGSSSLGAGAAAASGPTSGSATTERSKSGEPPKKSVTAEEARSEKIRRDFEKEVPLLKGEGIREKLNPHPLSFLAYFIHGILLMIFVILFLILFQSGLWTQFHTQLGGVAGSIGLGSVAGGAPAAAAYLLLIVLMIFFGIVVGRMAQEMGGYWWTVGYFAILFLAIGFAYFSPWDYKVNIPLFLTLSAIVVILFAELYRRAFRYYITTHRIVLVRKFLTHDEIFLRYTKIVDVDIHQGVLARMFGFGNIIPITSSSIGTGADAVTFSGDAVRDRRLQSPFDRGSVVSTTKSVQTGRARPDDSLYGVPNPFRVKALIAEMMEGMSEEGKLAEIRDLLKKQLGESVDEKPKMTAPEE